MATGWPFPSDAPVLGFTAIRFAAGHGLVVTTIRAHRALGVAADHLSTKKFESCSFVS
jgi:hypothetical protein